MGTQPKAVVMVVVVLFDLQFALSMDRQRTSKNLNIPLLLSLDALLGEADAPGGGAAAGGVV